MYLQLCSCCPFPSGAFLRVSVSGGRSAGMCVSGERKGSCSGSGRTSNNMSSGSSVQSYLIYYGIVCLILAPAILSGKRAFCHYFCWMAPFMVAGMKLRRLLRLPGLCVRENEKAECVSCGKCRRACPMGIDVEREIKDGSVQSLECILCGACIDSCPAKALGYGVRPVKSRRNFDKGHGNGGGKKT